MFLRAPLLCCLSALLITLSACSQPIDQPPPSPALWEISGEDGAHGYLFGTAHALPDGLVWRTDAFDQAFAQSDVLVVEVNLREAGGLSEFFQSLGHTAGLPPLTQRVSADYRGPLARVMEAKGMEDSDFSDTESWAAALAISQAYQTGDSRNGVDRWLLEQADGTRPIVELEGYRHQLSLFDTLPISEQADLLEAVVDEITAEEREQVPAYLHWLTGDVDELVDSADGGILTDPELRDILQTQRNRQWSDAIDKELSPDHVLFIAVGAAHLAGADGLPSLLEQKGYTVTRIQ